MELRERLETTTLLWTVIFTEKSPGDLKELVVTQTLAKDHQC